MRVSAGALGTFQRIVKKSGLTLSAFNQFAESESDLVTLHMISFRMNNVRVFLRSPVEFLFGDFTFLKRGGYYLWLWMINSGL
jgi:hypothetical protein